MSLLDHLVSRSLPLVPKPVVRFVARPYIAGETTDELVSVVRGLNAEGFMAASGILGEFVERRDEAESVVAEYEQLLAIIADQRLDCNVHVKPTHLGLKIDIDFCHQNIRRLLSTAQAHKNFVRLDMEDSTCTDETLEVFGRLQQEFDNVGIVVQARLRRSLTDVRRLAAIKANVRLCTGIYIEPRTVAYVDREVVRANYLWLLEELFDAGCYVGVATHDEMLVWNAARMIDQRGLDANDYEFQMLLGVEAPLRRVIRDAGHRLRVAAPFGPNWYPYSMRRLRKNPAIARHVLRALLRIQGSRE